MLLTIICSVSKCESPKSFASFRAQEIFRTGNISIIYFGCQYIIDASYFEKPTDCGRAIKLSERLIRLINKPVFTSPVEWIAVPGF